MPAPPTKPLARPGLLVAPCVLGVLLAGPAFAADGLVAEYGDGARRVTEIVATPNFSLLAEESIHPGVKPTFSASYTGAIKILVAGKYKFAAAPAVLTIDSHEIVDGLVDLAPGLHNVRLAYRRPAGPARLQVIWQSDAFAPESVPPAVWQHDAAPAAVASWARVARGRALVDDLNCLGCHGTSTGPVPDNAHGRGPGLANVGGRTSAAWIYRWLGDPVAYRAAARMPQMPLTETERRDLTAFLAAAVDPGSPDPGAKRDGPVTAADGDKPEVKAKGKALFESVGCAACHGQGPGLITSPAIGSKLSFTAMRAYLLRPERVDPTGRMPNMKLDGTQATALAAFLAERRQPAYESSPPAGDVAKGRSLFAARGCVACHAMGSATNTLRAPALSAVGATAGRGCLGNAPSGPAPRFRLTDEQRGDIKAYLQAPDVARAPIAEFRHAIEFFRCRACHEMGSAPLVSLGETAPSLDDTGNKLRTSWIREVLNGDVRTRHWLGLKMPNFPLLAAAAAQGFAAIAGAPRDDPPPPPKPDALTLRDGVRYLGRGEEGLACINCHDFAWFKSGSATPAPDMSTIGQRLRPDWFRRWMQDPQRILPGTQMPTYFADVDKDFAAKRIGDMWSALSVGRDMPLPEGVSADDKAVKIVVGKDPVVFRTFITGGAERSIAVGFPGGQSYAFDVDSCRVQFAWSGEFLDVRPVWIGRGGQKAIPLGERYYIAPEGFPLRIGDPGRDPARVRFRAYQLRGKIPTFIYEVDGAVVRETITPLSSGRGLERVFEMRGAPAGDVWFVPGPRAGVEITARGGAVDGDKRVHVAAKKGTPTRFTVTMRAGKP